MRYFFYKIGLKSKILLYKFGIKPSFKSYGFKIKKYDLLDHGQVEYAQWLHPAEGQHQIKQDVIRELQDFLKEGDFCIDIGAHTGDTTIPMALAVGKKGCVLALEPNRYVYQILEKNSSLNIDKTNIVPLMAAATLEEGEYEFEYLDPGFCNGGLNQRLKRSKLIHPFKLKVTGINLSSKLRNEYQDRLANLKFIKIDTEGYDLSVLRSIEDIIHEYHPFLRVEVLRGSSFEYRKEMYELLSKMGYAISRVNRDSDLKGLRIADYDLMNCEHYDIFCVPSIRKVNQKHSINVNE